MESYQSDTCNSHDIAMTHKLLKYAIQKVAPFNAIEITSISLEFGYLLGGDLSLIENYFSHISKGTIAEKAALDIRRKRKVIKCSNCNLLYFTKNMYLDKEICPQCNEKPDISPHPINCYIKEIQFT